VLARRSYRAASPPEKHPNRCVVFFPFLIDVQRVGWKLCEQASGQRRRHPQWLELWAIHAGPPCAAALETLSDLPPVPRFVVLLMKLHHIILTAVLYY
jgi:hypothetical protein